MAGVVGSGGGVSSLVSYPALLGVGIPPLQANIANLVAGVAIAPGAAVSSRRELTDARPALIRLLPVAVAGTVWAPVFCSSLRPGVCARRAIPGGRRFGGPDPSARLAELRGRVDVEGGLAAPTVLLIGAVSVYGGYFGAGSGVMLLAVLLVLVNWRIHRRMRSKTCCSAPFPWRRPRCSSPFDRCRGALSCCWPVGSWSAARSVPSSSATYHRASYGGSPQASV